MSRQERAGQRSHNQKIEVPGREPKRTDCRQKPPARAEKARFLDPQISESTKYFFRLVDYNLFSGTVEGQEALQRNLP